MERGRGKELLSGTRIDVRTGFSSVLTSFCVGLTVSSPSGGLSATWDSYSSHSGRHELMPNNSTIRSGERTQFSPRRKPLTPRGIPPQKTQMDGYPVILSEPFAPFAPLRESVQDFTAPYYVGHRRYGIARHDVNTMLPPRIGTMGRDFPATLGGLGHFPVPASAKFGLPVGVSAQKVVLIH